MSKSVKCDSCKDKSWRRCCDKYLDFETLNVYLCVISVKVSLRIDIYKPYEFTL